MGRSKCAPLQAFRDRMKTWPAQSSPHTGHVPDGRRPYVVWAPGAGTVQGVAVFLANESKGLLIGEGADRQTLTEIRRLAESDEAVEDVRGPLTVYFGPHTILLTMEIQFKLTIAARGVEDAVDRIEKKIRNRFPDIKHILIEAESSTKVERAAPAR